ncbi:MAG TPA: type I-U CRISPR-associated protein Cas7, partial [Bryobacteraceae bacterium]|nr:type I-U CRISPR-associated protein Cas7 [Bryobacteraceae bacterium]
KLAIIAPTSLVFGVWDSRSTQVKQQRVFRANIRATNVREVSRSAQYTPATAYVDVGAISEDIEKKSGDESNLSQEGMVHALSTQTVGGVMLTGESKLVRTVNVNLEAIRALRGTVPSPTSVQTQPETGGEQRSAGTAESAQPIDGTEALQRYILGLALVAATHEPELNLREGCHLRFKDGATHSIKLIYRSKPGMEQELPEDVLSFAETAKSNFFKLAGIDEETMHRRDAVLETNIAERFLSYPQGDRDKIRKLGPITQATLDRFKALGNDPFKTVKDELKAMSKDLGKKPRKNAPPVKKIEAFRKVAELLDQLAENEALPEGVADLASELAKTAREHDNSHDALKHIEEEIKNYKKAQKESTPTGSNT